MVRRIDPRESELISGQEFWPRHYFPQCSKESLNFFRRVVMCKADAQEAAVLLDTPGALDIEDFERRMTVLDDKLQAAVISMAEGELMLRIRRELDRQLSPYRRKMTPAQLAQVERQFIYKRLLEEFSLPRMSLFYLS